jgi:hypothetical protein
MGTSLILFILIGLVAGWLAGQIMKGGGFADSGDNELVIHLGGNRP